MSRIWAFGLTFILLTLILVGYNIQLQKKIILQDVRNNASSKANAIVMDLTRTMNNLEQTFLGLENSLSSPLNKKPIDAPSIRRAIDELVQKNPYITALVILDKDGQVQHWNNNFQKPNLSKRHYFRIHLNTVFSGLYIGPPQPSIINKDQWIFGISKAIRNNDHTLNKVFAAIVDLNYFQRKYQQTFSASSETLTIISPSGHIYANIPDLGNITGHKVPTDSLDAYKSNNEDDLLTTTRKLTDHPFYVTVKTKHEIALAQWKKSAINILIIGLIANLIILFATFNAATYQKRQKEIKERLRIDAMVDPLTGLFNRRHVLKQAKIEIKKASRNNTHLSIIMIDLDQFKKINDNYGHHCGDEVLEATATIIQECSRETDILSRIGGEKFLLVLPDTNMQGAMINAEKIRNRLEQTAFHDSGEVFHVTASLGVTQWAPGEEDITEAIQRSDDALYAVKNNGRNKVQGEPAKNEPDKSAEPVVWLFKNNR